MLHRSLLHALEEESDERLEARSRMLLRAPIEILSPADRARWRAADSPSLDLGPGTDTTFEKVRGLPIGLGMLSYQELRHLPTDPHRLLRVLARAARRSSTARSAPHFGPALLALTEFEAIRGLLVAPIEPAVRSALFRTAALVPGVRYVGARHDAIGRAGVAVALDWRGHSLSELIFDPATSALLGVSDADGRNGIAYTASGRVRSLRAVPAGVSTPFTSFR